MNQGGSSFSATPEDRSIATNPSAPGTSPFTSTSYSQQPQQQHPQILQGVSPAINYGQLQHQQQFFAMQQQQQQHHQQHQHPLAGPIFNVNPYEHSFDPYASSTTTNQQSIRVETVPLDLANVSSEEDKRTINTVHKNMINLMDDVPLFNEKVVDDMGHAYKVTFKWTDECWTYDTKALNEKILSINGVQTIHSGHKQLTVIVTKHGGITLTNGQNNISAPDFSSLDAKDPVVQILYGPSTTRDAELIRFIAKSHPSMPNMQKGLMLNFMKILQNNAKTSRKKAIKKEKGVQKRRQ
jgi:hypothetical protein